MAYLTNDEMKMGRREVNLQIALGLKSCEIIKEVCDLLNEVRRHERSLKSKNEHK